LGMTATPHGAAIRRTKDQLSDRPGWADCAEAGAACPVRRRARSERSTRNERDQPGPGERTMSDVSVLLDRIDAEFSALDDKIKRAQGEKQQEHKDRQQRLAAFER